MRSRQLGNEGDGRSTLLVFEAGDEVMSTLTQYACERQIGAATFQAIGAFSGAVLGYFDWTTKEYRRIPIEEQVEVTSLLGDIALDGDTPTVHAHIVLGHADGRASAGHLLQGCVRPTLELVLEAVPAHLRKRHDPESGLALIDPGA